EWLETYLSRYIGAILMVSHDREFLNRTVNQVFEIDEHDHRLKNTRGTMTPIPRPKRRSASSGKRITRGSKRRSRNCASACERLHGRLVIRIAPRGIRINLRLMLMQQQCKKQSHTMCGRPRNNSSASKRM